MRRILLFLLGQLLRPTSKIPTRSQSERDQTRLDAYRKLHLYLPDLIGSVTGRNNSKRGSTRIFEIVQNRGLNMEALYRAADAIQVFLQ